MKVNPIPEGFHTVTPYFVVSDISEFISYLENAFNAIPKRQTKMPDGTIMNAEIQIGNSMIMVGQANEKWPTQAFGIYLYVEDTDATYKSALEAGGRSLMEPADMFYGDRNAGVLDPFGNNWWIATHVEDVTDEEIEIRMQNMQK